jgi:Flp pilus assembly protein TadG
VVETALMIPVLLALTVLLLTAIQVGMTALHLTDTAHDLARGLARGISFEEIQHQAQVQAPDAQLTLSQADQAITVSLSQEVSLSVPLFSQLSFTLDREVTAPLELL